MEELQARVGTGTVKATGEVGLDGRAIGAYQVAVAARGVSFAAVEELGDSMERGMHGDRPARPRVVRGHARFVRGAYAPSLDP